MTVVRYLPIAQIRRRPDARPLDEAAVAALAESIREGALLNPVNVRLVGGEYFELIAGSHRLAATELLGEKEILVTELALDDKHAELFMIDENLQRSELSPAERSRQTARRKGIYEALHPEARREATLMQGTNFPSRQVGETGKVERFTADTAARTGQSERSVQRDAERGEKIIGEVFDLVKGTALETGAYFDRIKKLPPNDQFTAAKRDLALARTSQGQRERGSGQVVPAAVAAHVTYAATTGIDYHTVLRLLDELGGLAASDIIAACPVRERAALCSRLSHLTDVFHKVMEGVAP